MKKNNQKIILENLIGNIRREMGLLEELNLSIGPLVEKVEVADKEEKILYNRAAGSILHDFYTGIEKIIDIVTTEKVSFNKKMVAVPIFLHFVIN